MGTSTIPLAKGLDLKKMTFPALLSEKLDGVPVKVLLRIRGGVVTGCDAVTRQGKPVPSITENLLAIQLRLNDLGIEEDMDITLVAEVTHRIMTQFKDVSGVVRKKTAQPDLILNVFDCYVEDSTWVSFKYRHKYVARLLRDALYTGFRFIAQYSIDDEAEFHSTRSNLEEMNSGRDVEGYILRAANEKWEPGKRSWGYQKVLKEPTIDLRVVGYEEAVDKDGNPKGMVGRINCAYKGGVIGVGPGKMTHAERIDIWEKYGKDDPATQHPIIEIKYKKDDSYDALRQPTFQNWRFDKDTPDA